MSDFSRRSLVRGVAWTVPVVAVATHAPAFAASNEPPAPGFDFSKAYKNPGNSCKEPCIPGQSYGVPVTVQNFSGEDYFIQFTSYFIGSNAQGLGGTNVGVFGLTTGISGCPKNFPTGCSAGTCTTNPSLTSANSVCIPSGTTLTIFVTSNDNGSSPNGGQRIDYRWIRKSDCGVTLSSFASSATSPPNNVAC